MSTAPTTLPVRSRLLLVLSLSALMTVLYLLSNAHPLRPPALLPRNAIDAALGLHAWTIWPYWALLLLGPTLAVGVHERRLIVAAVRAYAIAMGLNLAIWLAWPTQLPRQPLPDDLDRLTEGAWRLLYALDAPTNCFPSGHITIPLVMGAAFCAQYPRARRWLWPLLVALLSSVVTTGQHYSWDVLGGAATAALGLALAGRELWRGARPAAVGSAPAAASPW